jgi:hypothetical protein
LGGGGGGGRGVGLAQNLEHHGAAGGAFALDGFAAVFHGFLNAVGDGLLGLALDAVSFRHKEFADGASCAKRDGEATGKNRQRQLQRENGLKSLEIRPFRRARRPPK